MNIISIDKYRSKHGNDTADDGAVQSEAFSAHAVSARAWRMRAYLLSTGSLAIAAADLGSGVAAGGTGARTKFSEMAALSRLYTQLQAALATTTLRDMITGIESISRSLHEALAEREQALKAINHDIARTQAQIADDHREASAAGDRAVKTAADLEKSRAAQGESETLSFDANAPLAEVENRAIKIVRNIASITEFRRSLREPETEAPEIYVVAALSDDGAVSAYDRLAMTGDGRIAITRIDAAHAPAFVKDGDTMTTDLTERAYARRTANGGTVFERMEYDAKGALMGRVGDITGRMLAYYCTATGRNAESIAPDAALAERRYRERADRIDAYADVSAETLLHNQMNRAAQENVREIGKRLAGHHGALETLHRHARVCRDDICSIRNELAAVEDVLNAASAVHKTVAAQGTLAPGAVLALLPRELHDDFTRLFRQREWEAMLRPRLALVWPESAYTTAVTGPEARAFSRQLMAERETLRLQPA